MSLDLYFYQDRDHTIQVADSLNITHNLRAMAEAAGIYEVVWRPEEVFVTPKAHNIDPILREGIVRLLAYPDHFKQFDAPNGWGVYEHFMSFLKDLYWTCLKHPNAYVVASR